MAAITLHIYTGKEGEIVTNRKVIKMRWVVRHALLACDVDGHLEHVLFCPRCGRGVHYLDRITGGYGREAFVEISGVRGVQNFNLVASLHRGCHAATDLALARGVAFHQERWVRLVHVRDNNLRLTRDDEVPLARWNQDF